MSAKENRDGNPHPHGHESVGCDERDEMNEEPGSAEDGESGVGGLKHE